MQDDIVCRGAMTWAGELIYRVQCVWHCRI